MNVTDRPVPVGFLDIEDWILNYLHHHPKGKHSTRSLLGQLEAALKAEPSRLEECNRIKEMIGAQKLTEEEYEALRKPDFDGVQRAVETLIKDGRLKFERDRDDRGVVFYGGIDLNSNGTKEAITRERTKEAKSKPPMSFERIVRET